MGPEHNADWESSGAQEVIFVDTPLIQRALDELNRSKEEFRALLEQAESGDSAVWYDLAIRYLEGDGVERDPAQAVQNGGHAGEVVGGQDRGAVGDDLSIPDLRLDAEAVLDPVHVGRQQDSALRLSLQHRDQISGGAVHLGRGVVLPDGTAQGLQLSLQRVHHGALLTGDRVDLRQLDEFFYNRYCHAASSLFVMVSQRCGTCAPSQNVLPWTPCGIATGVPIFGPSAETIANTGLSVPEHGLADVTGV